MNEDILEQMNISLSTFLELKKDPAFHPVKTYTPREDGLWSMDMLFRHLRLLNGLVPRKNEAAARLWINAFFYHVSAMILNMVLNVEPSGSLSGDGAHTVTSSINWTAISTSSEKSQAKLQDLASNDSILFVSEVKHEQLVEKHVAQTLFEMLNSPRTAGKTTIRGVSTNGVNWVFLILTLNEEGATYLQSKELTIYTIQDYTEKRLSKDAVVLVSSIIAHSVCLTAHAVRSTADWLI
ncbi:hypothetical protein NP233_g12777 [Leucocoprinus birnbaumii]|uniref:Uncharacterized protein n=1 Tax=Leucocoprinus birnbaumii TaxID=56174 RepID=A0AAD5YMR1_9AGAR|nr:hypothetical protein NP233_g12777 [Leucocoprinus birnbaumii]